MTDQNIGRQVQRETEGVVELEDRVPRQLSGAHRLEFPDLPFEQSESLGQRLEKSFFLAADAIRDEGASFGQFRKRLAHLIDDLVRNGMNEGRVLAQQLSVTRRASQNAPQDVAASGIARQDSVANQKRQRPCMIGRHAKRNVGLGVHSRRDIR